MAGLYCYPVKSCRGISLKTAEIGRFGIRFDRQWMVVDQAGPFVSQRGVTGMATEVRSMCFIETAFQEGALVLSAPDMPKLSVPLTGLDGDIVQTQVWLDACIAVDQGEEPARWFTKFLSRERPGDYRLIRMPDQGVRKTKQGDVALGFADNYPFLIIAQPSLDDLNRRMPEALPMNRFRPNIVLRDCEPYAEDRMASLKIRNVQFRGRTLCVRCPFTTANQLTAERGEEPLKTLATYRKTEHFPPHPRMPPYKGVVFGRKFDHAGSGTISVGDRVAVLAWD